MKVMEKLKAKKTELESKRDHYDEKKNTVVDHELELKQYDRLVTQVREKCDFYAEENKNICDAILNYDTSISVLSQAKKEVENKISSVNKELDNWESRVAEKLAEISNLKEKLNAKKIDAMNSEQYMHGFKDIIDQEEKNIKKMTEELRKLNKITHQRADQLAKLQKENSDLEIEISGAHFQLEKYRSKSQKLVGEVKYKLTMNKLTK